MNAEEFQKEVTKHRDKMFRLARRFLRTKEEAEDAVQDAFVKLWVRRNKLKKERNLEALAMITMKNLCIDNGRKTKIEKLSLNEDIKIRIEKKKIKKI